MRRAFVGFSSPIGYMYDPQASAERTANDQNTSPNPVLFGSMGVMTLYDEVWFACRSLCPQSMRKLPYVRFLDVNAGTIDLAKAGFDDDIAKVAEKVSQPPGLDLNSMFPEGFNDGMTSYVGGEYKTDNHTHQLTFRGTLINGNPGVRQMIADSWLMNRYRDLNLELVLNPLTARLGFATSREDGLSKVLALGLADRVLTLGSLYDITGKDGPYHPCIEEVRGDPLIVDFRLWMDEQTGRLDNYDIGMVEEEVNAGINELMRKSVRKQVDFKNLKETAVKIVKDELVGKLPGASALLTISDAIAQNEEAKRNRFKAFIALTRDTIESARPTARVRPALMR